MPVVIRSLIAVVAILISFVAPRPALATAAPSEALSKATTYLVTTIGDADHLTSEFGDESITADAVLALVATDDPAQKPLIERLTTWLEGRAKKYAGAAPESAAKLALVAAATGTSASDFGGVDLVAAITKGIKKDGSFGSYPGTFAQSLGIMALVRSNQQVPEAMASWLLAQQATDGGFSYELGKDSDADSTGMAVTALAGLKSDAATAALAKAVAWAQKAQQSDGSWAGFNPVNSTAVMTMGMIAAKVDPAAGVAYLAGQQLASGALPNAGKPDLLATLQSMVPLSGHTYLSLAPYAEVGPTASPTETQPSTSSAAPSPANSGLAASWLPWVAVLALAVIAGGFWWLRRRRT